MIPSGFCVEYPIFSIYPYPSTCRNSIRLFLLRSVAVGRTNGYSSKISPGKIASKSGCLHNDGSKQTKTNTAAE